MSGRAPGKVWQWQAGVALAVLMCVVSLPATADSVVDMEVAATGIRKNVIKLRKQYLSGKGLRGGHYPERRLVDGVNHYDLGDYQRASIILLDIIENFPDHPAFPEALYYYADSLFLARDFYGARTEFQRFLNFGDASGFTAFRAAAIARLVEVAVHLDDFTQVGEYIELLSGNTDARARYIKGKYYYFQTEYEQARREFAGVEGDEALALKSAYFIGASFVKEALLDDAAAAFATAVGRFSQVRPANRALLDLLYLGLGRVQYEKDDVENAIEAYSHIDKYSPYYDVALYESAAVNMRAGNTISAERILEVLTLAIPDSRYIPRAKLLRGQLLSSAGRYDEAETVFEQTIDEFEPVQKMMEQALAQSGDSGEFFDLLMARSVEALDVRSMIPREVVTWASEEPEVKRAFVLTDDLAKAQAYTGESERLADLIGAVVNGTSAVNAIPMLRNATRQNQQFRNQLAKLTMRFLDELEDDLGATQGGDLAARRARLTGAMEKLPIDDSSFKTRERAAKQQYTALRLQLAQYETMLDKLRAVITGLERYIEKPEYRSQVSKAALTGYQSQLTLYRGAVENIRDGVAAVKLEIEKASYQIGIGGEQDTHEFALVRELFSLAAQYEPLTRYAGRNAGEYQSALGELLAANQDIARLNADIETVAIEEVAKIRRELIAEQAKLKQYRMQLDALNTEARTVVNGVARENFSGIRQRFQDLMIRADVGIVDIAWMKKEEHKARVVKLSQNRTNEIQWLDEEFEESDGFSSTDASESQKSSASQQ
ncbi:MAG: tetratricopeptide repeat protein [Deltaproteobacteria bacterium]|nr:tetratricopeptide repeat protein [Deltaproteobacteria bacterium]